MQGLATAGSPATAQGSGHALVRRITGKKRSLARIYRPPNLGMHKLKNQEKGFCKKTPCDLMFLVMFAKVSTDHPTLLFWLTVSAHPQGMRENM